MQIQQNISLKPYHSFGVELSAKYFAVFGNLEELNELCDSSYCKRASLLILGGGSNILFTHYFDGLVMKNNVKGIDLVHEDAEYVYLRGGAGENWHQFVLYCIGRGWGGLENLSLIPGNIGAAPIQNIGAYGVELENLFWSLEAFSLADKKVITFTKADCEFGYRDSIFKNKHKGEFVILNVTFRLRKNPVFHISYGAIQQELERMGIHDVTIRAISQAVINIRSSKLPDPALIGNAGSFFKNPTVSKETYELLKVKFPGLVGYPNLNGSVKLAAGWLIEQCGPDNTDSWKGYRNGDVGCYTKQALVLVNYGHASGKEVYDLSVRIVETVHKKFNIVLEREVNIF